MKVCSTSLNLTKEQLNRINTWLKVFPKTFEQKIRENFQKDDADKIVEIAKGVISKNRIEITPRDLDITFEIPKSQNVDKVVNRSFATDIPESNYGGDPGAFNRMKKNFSDAIVAVSIFDIKKNQVINPLKMDLEFGTVLNRNMFNYKMNLIKRLADYIGISVETEYKSPEVLFQTIQTVLQGFNAKNSKELQLAERAKLDTNTDYIQALDAYTILSNFDKFLKDFTPFVKTRDGFEEYEAKERYEYVGPNTNMRNTYIGDTEEKGDMEDNISDLAGILLEYFPEYDENGNPIEGAKISKSGFFQVMTSFKEWIDEVPVDKIVSGGDLSDIEKRRQGIARLNSYYEGDETAAKLLFDTFISRVKSNMDALIDTSRFNLNKLYGIKQMFNAKLSKPISRMFWNLAYKTSSNIGKSTSFYQRRIQNKQLRDQYKTEQWGHIQDAIHTAVHQLYINPALYEDIKKTYGINDFLNGKFELFQGTRYSCELSNKGTHYDLTRTSPYQEGVPDDVAKQFIEDVLGIPVPNNYKNLLNQLSDHKNRSLFNLYANAIGVVWQGVSDLINESDSLNWNNWDGNNMQHNINVAQLNLAEYNTVFDSLQTFLGMAYGTNVTSVNRNSFGNNVAAYNLRSMIKQVPQLAMKLQKLRTGNSYQGNPVYQALLNQRDAIGQPITRIDVNINGKRKKARDLTESEVAYVGIMVDFWQNFYSEYGKYIELQNTAFADKNTHFSIPYSKNLQIGSTTLSNAIEKLVTAKGDDVKKYQEIFETEIFNSRKNLYQTVLNNLYNDYLTVFSKVRDKAELQKIYDTLVAAKTNSSKINTIVDIISTIGVNPLKNLFKSVGVEFVEELHASNNGFNETLLNGFNTYLFNSRSKFKQRLNKQKRFFLKDLTEVGFKVNSNFNKVVVNRLLNDIGDSWRDDVSGDITLAKENKNGELELNPILDTYFYTDVLLSTSYNDILFGRMFFHPNKYKPNKIRRRDKNGIEIDIEAKDIVYHPKLYTYYHISDVIDDDFEYDDIDGEIKFDENGKIKYSDNYFAHCEASRLSASYKRTVNAGATVHSMLPIKYGINPEGIVAFVNDIKAPVYNMMGISDEVDAWDGSALSSPIQAIFENWSLIDAAVGMDKKTIFGDVDAKYGMPTLLKWATFALTNDRRQISMGSDVSAEVLFKKMHSKLLGKRVNISKYYQSSFDIQQKPLYHDYIEQRALTHTSDIFKYDINTGKYYIIANLNQAINSTTATWDEIEVDKNGNKVIGGEVNNKYRDITSIYDIDQVFGGAYAMSKRNGRLEYDIVNNTITANIVCAENLKDKFISYIINKSACKVGSRNLNSSDLLYANNGEDFNTSTVSFMFGGVQMDPDHDLKESDVTEMSQMISALIQNGYFKSEVNKIYSEIGEVVANSLKLKLNLLSEDKQTELHQILGKDLIESFANGSRDTIGLAQSYLLKAAQKLEAGDIEVNIPFSDPTVFGAFVADLISNINKSGIRRRYAGAQAVLVPSRGMMQYYQLGDIQYTYNDLCKYLYSEAIKAGIKYNQPILNYIRYSGNYNPSTEQWELNGEVHPFINKILDPMTVDMGDYIIYIDENGNRTDYNINTWENFDMIRHRLKNGSIFKWSIKPRDLRQSDTTFYINDKKYSIYDLDSVRASHYLSQLENIELSTLDPEIRFIIENGIKRKLPDKGILISIQIKNLIKLANRQLKKDLKSLDEHTNLGYNTTFGNINDFQIISEIGEISFIPIVGENVQTRFAEIMMGRLNAEALGLLPGDSISEIKTRKEDFFKDHIKADYTIGNINNNDIPKNIYDIVLIGGNSEKLFVSINSLHKNQSVPEGFSLADNIFENRNNRIFYKDQEICQKSTKRFYTKGSPKGNINLLFVDSFEELEELVESPMYYDMRYNYRLNNLVQLVNYQYDNAIIDDQVTKNIYFTDNEGRSYLGLRANDRFSYLVKANPEYLNSLLANLRENEQSIIDVKVDKQARFRYAAFLKQLQYVGARIPTQSMQSFMGLELVGFTNNTTAEVYVPASQTWLQGSDYDVDKLYILGFEIGKNGKLQTFSKLQNLTDQYNSIMRISKPNGIVYTESENGYLITNEDVANVLSNNFNIFSNIIDSGLGNVTFTPDVQNGDKYNFLKLLKKHTTSKLSKMQEESALKNSIVDRIIRLLEHPRNQISGHIPISMEDLRELAKSSSLGNKEKLMTSDNPMTKFIMQVQNMVGRDVIGISAVGLKVFFATTAFLNERITQLVQAINNSDSSLAGEILNDLVFNDPLIEGEIATLANLNFEPVLQALQNNPDFIADDYIVNGELLTKFNWSSRPLISIITELQEKADTIDASESLSELISSATDNAKELILAKINATVDFADAWSYLISTGHPVNEIGKIMLNPIFGLVTKYTKTDVFSDIISNGSPQRAIDFVLGKSQLPGIDLKSLKLVLGAYRKRNQNFDNNCFIDKLLYETETNGVDRGKIKLFNGIPRRRSDIPLIDDNLAELLLQKGSDERQNIFSLFSSVDDPFKALTISRLILDHLYYLIKSKPKSQQTFDDDYEDSEDYNEELDLNIEDYSDYEPVFDYDDYQDDYEKEVNSEDFGEDSKFTVEYTSLVKLYRYFNDYVIPKNIGLHSVEASDIKTLQMFDQNVMPAVEEQQINGSILGVNQGIRTNIYDFYSRLKRVENFVNKRVNKNISEEDDSRLDDDLDQPFNIIRFLDDEVYRNKWIQQMDRLKTSTNSLRLIWNVPNFREMYKLNSLAYHLIHHSTQGDLLFKLSDLILQNGSYKLNEEEFDVLSKYIRDTLIGNWLALQDIEIKLPTISPITYEPLQEPFGSYIVTEDGDAIFTIGKESININTSEGQATFINLFENWIIPFLKHKYKDTGNAFIRSITRGNKFSKTHGINIHHARLAINTMRVDASVATQMEYGEILNDFNKIADDQIGSLDINIKDALFLYNTLVYRNAFAKNGFTRLMETINVRGDNALVNDWSQFLADLDAGKYEVKENITVDENTGNMNISEVIQANIKDLLYRLSFTKNAQNKFGVTQVRDEDGAISELVFIDMFENPDEDRAPIFVKNPNANDWVNELPVSSKLAIIPKDKGFRANYAYRYSYNSKEIIKAVTEAIKQKFDVSDIVEEISINDIKEAWAKSNNGEETELFIKNLADFNRMLDANAFIHNGKIWIITDKLNNESVLHEVLHLVFAAMKFNPNEEVRSKYYNLLEEATELVKSDKNLYQKLRSKYDNDYASDFKEELLVYKLTDLFKSSLKKKFNTYQFTDNVTKFVVDRLNEIFETEIPENINPAKLGNTTLSDIMQLFKSKLVDRVSNPVTSINILKDNQKIKTLKRILIKASENPDKKNFIKYDC